MGGEEDMYAAPPTISQTRTVEFALDYRWVGRIYRVIMGGVGTAAAYYHAKGPLSSPGGIILFYHSPESDGVKGNLYLRVCIRQVYFHIF